MNNMKQVLSIEQMQYLQELGLDTGNASMLYCRLYDEFHDERYILVESKHKFDKEENAIILDGIRNSVIYCKKITPVYTLQDVLELLPATVLYDKRIYELDINMCDESIEYVSTSVNDVLVGLRFTKIPLIDAAYSMLCWSIENGYVETNKKEKK